MSVLEMKNVKYSYGKHMVLRDINAQMEQGKMYAIIGPSGCGKTTLLSLLGGLDCPSEGQVILKESAASHGLTAPLEQAGNINIAEKSLAWHRKNNVAFIFQNYNLIDYMNPMENVALTAKEPPLPILKRLGLTEEESRRNVLKLSGGQQQRVAIARALASDAAIILADEPTGNLDEDTAEEITAILKECAHQRNKCVIIVTHSEELAKQADVVFRLKKGRLLRV